MSRFYQGLDRPLFDYQLFELPGIAHALRGPAIDTSGRYGVCIGAAQTFGRFCDRPFPAILGDALGMPVLNLAIGGCGPALYRQRPLLEILKRAELVVAQVMSGRSASNSEFHTDGGIQGRIRRTGETSRLEPLLAELLEHEPRELIERVLAETRADYAEQFAALLDEVATKTVVFWFARRSPDYVAGFANLHQLMGGFPQLVDRATLDAFLPHADAYAECLTSRGLPQRLWRADEPVEGTRRESDGHLYNHYYPTPEMHEDAAAILAPICAELVGRA